MIRILIADDHLVVADGLRCLLARQKDIEVIGCVTSGLEATALILQRAPGTRVVMLSREGDAHHVARALRAGAAAYVTKQASGDELLTAGRTHNEIASLLSLSARTVETYRSRMMRKLEVRDLASLMRFAIRYGFCTLE